jgi:hypothetical protein
MGLLSGRQWMSEEGVPEDTGKWGYTDASGNRVGMLRDMLDGGGRGRAGQRFEGGLLADIANALGFKPLGYQDRLAAARPMARPTRPQGGGGAATAARAPMMSREERLTQMEPMLEPNVPPRPVAMGDWGSPVNMSWVDSSALGYPEVAQYPLTAFGDVMYSVDQLGETADMLPYLNETNPSPDIRDTFSEAVARLNAPEYSGRGEYGMPMAPIQYGQWLQMSRREREKAGLPTSYIGGQLYFNRFGAGF